MRMFLLVVVTIVFAGCSTLGTPTQSADNHAKIYRVTAQGHNQTKMKSLYKIVMQNANRICKKKERKYIHVLQLVDEMGTGYNADYSTVIHFKRPQLYLTFSCVDEKVGRVVLVK